MGINQAISEYTTMAPQIFPKYKFKKLDALRKGWKGVFAEAWYNGELLENKINQLAG